MNHNSIDDLPSPSSDCDEVPSKRQKLDTINTSDSDSIRKSKWEKIGLTRELESVESALSITEATVAHLRKMRKEMEEIFDEEERVLEIQARVKRETIEYLKARLETTVEARAPQATLEAEMVPIECRIMEKMKSLSRENCRLNECEIPWNLQQTPTSSKFKENVSEEPQIVLGQRIKIETQELHLQNPELEEVNIETEKYDSVSADKIPWEKEKKCANEFAEQLQSANCIISTLRKGLNGKLHFEERHAEGVEQQVVRRKSRESRTWSAASKHETPRPQGSQVILMEKRRIDDLQKGNGNFEESDLQFIEAESTSDPTDTEESPWDSPSDQSEDDDGEASEVEQSRQYRRIIVGDCHVLPSDEKFFKINWEKHYRHDRTHEYVCSECSQTVRDKMKIQDHIWVQHYKGHFRCPLCPPSHSMRWRYNIGKHMRSFHSNDSW